MRIAQVAPLYESVPPLRYGGTERVVSWITEELVRQGHDVTLFASGDSQTRARLVAPCPRSLRLDPDRPNPLAWHQLLLERVFQAASSFDVIHFHVDWLHFGLSRRVDVPQVTTLHGRLDLPELQPMYAEYVDMPVVSISHAQRQPLPDARWVATVHHGLPPTLLPLQPQPGEYLAFIGRISPEKRLDRAIRIARAVGCPLRVAAKVDVVDEDYFQDEIRPLMEGGGVEYIGEIGDEDKGRFLGGARALLFPIDWPEPFGLAMIEAMACGTPVVAWRNGSVPEVVDPGVTGFIVESEAEAVEAVQRAGGLDRTRCREVFERRFSAERMARDYLDVYRAVQAARSRPHRLLEGPPLVRRWGSGPSPATADGAGEP